MLGVYSVWNAPLSFLPALKSRLSKSQRIFKGAVCTRRAPSRNVHDLNFRSAFLVMTTRAAFAAISTGLAATIVTADEHDL